MLNVHGMFDILTCLLQANITALLCCFNENFYAAYCVKCKILIISLGTMLRHTDFFLIFESFL